MKACPVDPQNALDHLLDLLSIEGMSGREYRVTEVIEGKLADAGCHKSWMITDDAHRRLGAGFETGNLIVTLPGSVRAPRILFSAHMDTVPLCCGAVPEIRETRVEARDDTGLGGDDRSGCAALVVLAEILLQKDIPHPPVTFLFLVAEENGLNGSRMVRLQDLGDPVMGFNLDGQGPNEVVIGAMSAVSWRAEVQGISSHAGLEPHMGVSAGLIAAKAMTAIAEKGYFGKIIKGRRSGTSNLGAVNGGEASNQVMDHVVLTGECRSHNQTFLNQISRVHKTCFTQAAKEVTNAKGIPGKVTFSTKNDYRTFRLKKSEPCVRVATCAIESVGLKPKPLVMDAGLDANNFNEKGLPTVTLGTGTHKFHQRDEYIEIKEYLAACEMLLQIVQISASA